MEPLKELNKIAQKPEYKKVGNWMARHITRDMALPFTWLFLHLPITANGVTLIAFVFGIAGCVAFSFGSSIAMISGAILLQLWYLFDHIDGQIARYKKEVGVTGVFFDYITHHLIHMGIFLGLGWGVYSVTSNTLFILAGIITSLNILVLNLMYDSQYKAFFHAVTKNFEPVKEGHERLSTEGARGRRSAVRGAFSFIHKLCEVHVVMNVVTALAVASLILKGYFLWDKFMIIYLAASGIAGITKASYFIVKSIPDREYSKFILRIYEKNRR